MPGITLSSAVRQNLLSLQSTAELLSSTQNRLSTGNKVNSALDNPTNFFTASSLNARSSDINNLLDGIGNGVQILQAANTGITSIQKLVDSAKSIANQALQTTSGYSAKASVTSAAITSNGVPVTASDLRGTGTVSSATLTGTATTTGSAPITAATTLASLGITSSEWISSTSTGGMYAVTFSSTTGNFIGGFSNEQYVLDLSVANVGDVLAALHASDGNTWSVDGSGSINVSGPNPAPVINQSGTPLDKLGLTDSLSVFSIPKTFSPVTVGGTVPTTGSTQLSNLSSAITASDTLTVNGKTISFANSGGNSFSANGATIDLSTATTQNILTAIDTITGTSTASTITSGVIQLNGGPGGLALTGSALSKLGLSATTGNAATASANGSGAGTTLSFNAVGNGTATTVTFGDGSNGTVKTLDQLNAQLAADNLQATLDTSGRLTITTTNDAASSTIPTLSGTAVSGATGAFHSSNITAPVADAISQATRASLVSQYNQIISNITATAQDSSFNGVNLLNGDTLKLTFNETGSSKLSISGVNFGPGGLGLASLTKGADFIDGTSTNQILASLNNASTTLRSQASSFGSNLSVVQIRQDFSKSLINVLQTGASNLTLADTNEEAANSQALSTRQSIAVSALSLANTAQQGVLQLLR